MTIGVKKDKAKRTTTKSNLRKVRAGIPVRTGRLKRIREDYGIDCPIFARLLGVEEATLEGWEKTGAPLQGWKKAKKVEKLLAGLSRVMRKDFLPTWLQTPNDACQSAGGRTPIDLMEKGKYQKIEAMIYFFESGTAF